MKLNIKRLLLLSQWVLLVHEGPSGARIPAEMRPRAGAGGGNLSAGPELCFPNSQNPPFYVWQSLFPLPLMGYLLLLFYHLQ